MSKNIDPDYITPDDLEYIKQRPTLQREFVLQGYGDPLEQDSEGKYVYAGLVDKDGERLNPDAESPSLDSDPDPDGLPDGSETNVQDDLPDDQKWDDEMDKAALQAVVDARNEDRDAEDEDSLDPIEVTGTGSNGNVKKDDLLKALSEDDTYLAEQSTTEE